MAQNQPRVQHFGEVYTDPDTVAAVISMLPAQAITPTSTCLEPACGNGNFLVQLLQMKLDLIQPFSKEDWERRSLDSLSSIYGIDILFDNCQECRNRLSELILTAHRRFYGEPDAEYLFAVQTVLSLHILCGNTLSMNLVDKNQESLGIPILFPFSSGAISLSDLIKKRVRQPFDLIIGNVPFSRVDGGGTGDSAKPIYHQFMEQAIKLDPRWIAMILPSKWMRGGKGLEDFRISMIDCFHLRELHDFELAKELFPSIELDGGICYFLYDREYRGQTRYYFKPAKEAEIYALRYLRNTVSSLIIRDHRQLEILKKVKKLKEDSFSTLVAARNHFGLPASLFNDELKHPGKLRSSPFPDSVQVYGVQGNKGASRRISGYLPRAEVPKGHIEDYKLFFSKAYRLTTTIPPKIIEAGPSDVCTDTFLCIGPFKTEEEQQNCLTYMKTKFFRFLLQAGRAGMNNSRASFDLIPLLDFSKVWTDQELYQRYHLTAKERAYIDVRIKDIEEADET